MRCVSRRNRDLALPLAALSVGIAGSCLAAENPGNGDTIRTLPIVRYISTTRGARLDKIPPQDLADLYVSAQISSSDMCGVVGPHDVNPRSGCSDDSNTVRRYAMERDPWFARLFTDKKVFIAGSAHISITNPALSVTRPLFTIEHDTVRGAPDVFMTEFSASDAQAPLFRLEADTIITVSIGENVKKDVTSVGAAAVISAVQIATRIAAPHAAVLTALSAPDVQNATNAIDSTIGALLSTDKSETIDLGNRLMNWDENDRYSIVARAPDSYVKIRAATLAGSVDPDAAPAIGHWYVWLSCPQPSIFSAKDICETKSDDSNSPRKIINPDAISTTVQAVETQIVSDLQYRAESILDTHLSAQITVKDFITSQSFYTDLLQKPKRGPTDTAKFCASTIDALHRQGLSHFDGRLVVWAMSQNMPGIQSLGLDSPGTAISDNCAELVGPLIKWPKSVAATPA